MRNLGFRFRIWLYLSLSAAFFIVLLCFLLSQSSESVERNALRRILLNPPTYNPERENLVRVLRRVTMPDRTVIVTMVDEAWARTGSILDVFLQSFKVGEGTHRFLNHLMIITTDAQAFEYCSSLHPHCIHPSIFPQFFGFKTQSSANPDHNMFSWRRNYVLFKVLELGYNIIFTDADVMWLRSPLSHFNPLYELSISCDFSSYGQRGGDVQDGGLFFLKANVVTWELFKYWNLMKLVNPNSPVEKSLCSNIVKDKDVIAAYGLRVQYVNTTYFGGFCQMNKDMFGEVYSMHANCCDDPRSKVHDLRLVLDDWINFRARLSENHSLEFMALRWRAPHKCL